MDSSPAKTDACECHGLGLSRHLCEDRCYCGIHDWQPGSWRFAVVQVLDGFDVHVLGHRIRGFCLWLADNTWWLR